MVGRVYHVPGDTFETRHPTLIDTPTMTNGDDTQAGTAEDDAFYAGAGVDTLDGGNGRDFIHGGDGDDVIDGSKTLGNDRYQDTLFGDDGNDLITGRQWDIIDGGAGQDHLILNLTGTSNWYTIDMSLMYSKTTAYVLGDGATSIIRIEHVDAVRMGSGYDTVTGSFRDDLIYGGSGNDTLDGAGGNDRLYGEYSDDTVSGGDGDDLILGGEGQDKLYGGEGNDTIDGEGSNNKGNTLDGGGGNDVITARIKDKVDGGTGFDTVTIILSSSYSNYTFDLAAITAGGTYSHPDFTLTGVEAIQELILGSGFDTVQGSAGADRVDGGGADDVLNGLAGNDTLLGGAGLDTLNGGADNDLLYGGASNDTLSGGTGTDQLEGEAGDDWLDGGEGADTMTGGDGNDTYVVDQLGDTIVEGSAAGSGIDTVRASISYTLGAGVEGLVLTGSANLNGTGNGLANTMTGNDGDNTLEGENDNDTLNGGGGTDSLFGGEGNDRLDGGTGADMMNGGNGDDIYIVDNAGDTTSDASGTDRVETTVSYALGAGIEQLVLVSGAINGTGNDLVNTITGNGQANFLDGGIGADTLIGGAGNDDYWIDNVGDVVIDTAGIDTVHVSINYELGGQIENAAVAAGAVGNFVISGNGFNNLLFGGAGNDTLNGAAGNDTMNGGAGYDTYAVDSVDDAIVDGSGGGQILATVSYNLGWATGSLDKITLKGSANINATGAGGNDTLVGNSGNNQLDGQAGADKMSGGAGNDSYVVDSIGDQISENSGEGSDTVYSSVGYTLGANVENLTLQGSGGIAGTGNTLANTITGNGNANAINGGDGGDWLDGKDGGDTLTGGAGADTFAFTTALNPGMAPDVITDFTVGQDQIWLSSVTLFGSPASGPLPPSWFGYGSQDASDRVIYDPATGFLYLDLDGTSGNAPIHFATLPANLAIDSTSFVLG